MTVTNCKCPDTNWWTIFMVSYPVDPSDIKIIRHNFLSTTTLDKNLHRYHRTLLD